MTLPSIITMFLTGFPVSKKTFQNGLLVFAGLVSLPDWLGGVQLVGNPISHTDHPDSLFLCSRVLLLMCVLLRFQGHLLRSLFQYKGETEPRV